MLMHRNTTQHGHKLGTWNPWVVCLECVPPVVYLYRQLLFRQSCIPVRVYLPWMLVSCICAAQYPA